MSVLEDDHNAPALDERSAAMLERPMPAATHDVTDAHVIVNPSLNWTPWVLHDEPLSTVFITE